MELFHLYARGMDIPASTLSVASVNLEGSVTQKPHYISAAYAGEEGVYQFQYKLETPVKGNGVGAIFRLRGWEDIRYIALGYTHKGKFRHLKCPNIQKGQWCSLVLGHRDLVFLIQNDFRNEPNADISDVRLYIKGTPGKESAALDIKAVSCFRESSVLQDWLAWPHPDEEPAPRQTSLLEETYSYISKYFKKAQEQAEAIIGKGMCGLVGNVNLEWSFDEAIPSALDSVNTYRYSWHALHPAAILMLDHFRRGKVANLFFAREMVNDWIENSFFHVDNDKKYAWYDHGTAERTLALALMWQAGLEYQFDQRFMQRLRYAIFRHGQLLDSEAFYASHQSTRYHNHAWFQDIALMATAHLLADFPCATDWYEKGARRLADQLHHLIVQENGYSVFVENSIDYHQGVQRLVRFAANIARIHQDDRAKDFQKIADNLDGFSEFLSYPDGRRPAQGDTMGSRNNRQESAATAYEKTSFTLLPETGYAVAKGKHDGKGYMLSLFATGLSQTHKHEDNLSFTLFFDGLEWLTDPSFYSHEYTQPTPAYLRSALAHNCLALPGIPYSIEPGHTKLDGECKRTKFVINGSHTAYKGATITRNITGNLNKLAIRFEDKALLAKKSQVEPRLLLQCGDGVRAALKGTTVTLSHPDSKYSLGIQLPSDRITIQNGVKNEKQVSGIYGLGFMEQLAINTISLPIPPGQAVKWTIEALGE